MFHPPLPPFFILHTSLLFQRLLDSVVYDLRDGDIENDMTQTHTHTRITFTYACTCLGIESNTGYAQLVASRHMKAMHHR